MDTRTFIDAYNAIAQDWARTQSGRRGTLPPVRGVSWRRTWPESAFQEDVMLSEGPATGWSDSTLDLRDGLSVIEVYADPDPSVMPALQLDLSRFAAQPTLR